MIRHITEKDIPVILGWYNWYISNSTATYETEELSLEQFSQRVKTVTEKYPWLVLEENGVLKGYAYLSPFNPRSAYIWTADAAVYVDPLQKGRGYGKQLMIALCAIAQKDGYKKIVSLVTQGNTASERLHESCGFEKKAVFDHFGWKSGMWLGVTYYVRDLSDVYEESPAVPVNKDYKESE